MRALGNAGACSVLASIGDTRSETRGEYLAAAYAGYCTAACVSLRRGIKYLTDHQGDDGFLNQRRYTATGFPRVFYPRYHGYSKFFPLWAMAPHRNLKDNTRAVAWGM